MRHFVDHLYTTVCSGSEAVGGWSADGCSVQIKDVKTHTRATCACACAARAFCVDLNLLCCAFILVRLTRSWRCTRR